MNALTQREVEMIPPTTSSDRSLEELLKGSDEYKQFLRDRPAIMKAIKMLEFFQSYNDRMELQQMLVALYAFYLDDQERTPVALRGLMDAYSSTVSRNLAAISNIGIRGKPGYKWVTLEEDPQYRTRKNIKVTQRGHKVRRMVAAIVNGEI